jgi:hypothetical protein
MRTSSMSPTERAVAAAFLSAGCLYIWMGAYAADLSVPELVPLRAAGGGPEKSTAPGTRWATRRRVDGGALWGDPDPETGPAARDDWVP